ncbi:MAG: integrase core domain-containing protein [Selenomonadaceae bacterium]
MEERVSFIYEYLSGAWIFSDLCSEFSISRPTGYKFVERYENGGIEALDNLSKTPHSSPNRTPDAIQGKIFAMRKKHPRYGPKKLRVLLTDRYPDMVWPALSTIAAILKNNDYIPNRRHIRRITPVNPIFDPTTCNMIWSGDFKGKAKLGDHQYVYPLTIADSYSRYLFAAKGLLHPTFAATKAVLIRVFRQWGIPEQFHTDNGSPFAGATSLARLSTLAVWLLEHDIMPVYSDPGCPSQNGRHERMHRELKAEAARPPAANLKREQLKLNKFVKEYNTIRPHEALGQKTPASVHVRSKREYNVSVTHWEYPNNVYVRRVYKNGCIRWGSDHWVMVATPLIDKEIGLMELGNGIWRIFFRNKFLGYLNEKNLHIQGVTGHPMHYYGV